MSQRFFITTAIYYVNGQPHLGHAYEQIVTDVIARSRRSLGEEVYFLTGLDEHGQKVQQAAHQEGKEPQAYCDELAASWSAFTARLNLTNNGFVRTTDPKHKRIVQAILQRLQDQGHFYKAQYKGFYSVKEETFLTDRDRLPEGGFSPAFGEVTELIEENYFFKLKDHQAWLIETIEGNPDLIQPSYRRNEVLGFLKNNTLEDLCISRPASRLNWGIPLPFDANYVTFVWFDALVNYISVPAMQGDPLVTRALGATPEPGAAGLELWPAAVHMIGKDILKFHAVYWPIMLKAMDLPLPRQILAHGFWQKDSQKISKATGNIVDPVAIIDEWGVDAFRYYVVRELDLGPDGNWTDRGFLARYKDELADGLGNLINRSLSMLKRYRDGRVPPRSDELAPEVSKAAAQTAAHFRQFSLQDALIGVWKLIARTNQYVDQTAPFKLAKDPSQSARLGEILYNLAETSRILAVLLWPVLPATTVKIYEQLGLRTSPDRWTEAQWGGLAEGHTIGTPAALFPLKDLRTPRA